MSVFDSATTRPPVRFTAAPSRSQSVLGSGRPLAWQCSTRGSPSLPALLLPVKSVLVQVGGAATPTPSSTVASPHRYTPAPPLTLDNVLSAGVA